MKKIILFSSFVALTLATSAQSVITPDKFDFSKWPVGALSEDAGAINKIDHVGAGYLGAATVTENLNAGGVIQLAHGDFSDLEHSDIARVKSGLSIIDLGGEVGKVLCFKGHGATYDKGIAASEDFSKIKDFTLNFYLDPAKTKTAKELYFKRFPEGTEFDFHTVNSNTARAEAIIRTTIVFKIIDNKMDPTEYGDNKTVGLMLRFGNGTSGSNTSYSSRPLADVTEDEEGEMTAISKPNAWLEVSTDGYVNQDPAKPYTINLRALTAGEGSDYSINNKTLLIKSIKLTTDYRLGDANFYPSLETVGEVGFANQNQNTTIPQMSKRIELKDATVGIDAIANVNKPFYTVAGNQVTLNNLQEGNRVAIVAIGGQQISNFTAKSNTATFTLNKGYYIAKIGAETLKMIVF